MKAEYFLAQLSYRTDIHTAYARVMSAPVLFNKKPEEKMCSRNVRTCSSFSISHLKQLSNVVIATGFPLILMLQHQQDDWREQHLVKCVPGSSLHGIASQKTLSSRVLKSLEHQMQSTAPNMTSFGYRMIAWKKVVKENMVVMYELTDRTTK